MWPKPEQMKKKRKKERNSEVHFQKKNPIK